LADGHDGFEQDLGECPEALRAGDRHVGLSGRIVAVLSDPDGRRHALTMGNFGLLRLAHGVDVPEQVGEVGALFVEGVGSHAGRRPIA